MNLIGALSLLWQLLKITVANEMVNTAMDHWVAGTSNKIDDWLWALLESVAGVENTEERNVAFVNGLTELQMKYDAAKADGSLDELKATKRSWAPPTMDDVRLALAGERMIADNIA